VSPESPSTAPEWPVPRATTSGDSLQLAHPVSSSLSHLARVPFLTVFFQMGRREEGGGGGGGSDGLCPYFSNFSVSLQGEGREGGNQGGIRGGGGGGGGAGGGGVKAKQNINLFYDCTNL